MAYSIFTLKVVIAYVSAVRHAACSDRFLGLRRYIPEHNTVHLILVLYQKNHLHVRYFPYSFSRSMRGLLAGLRCLHQSTSAPYMTLPYIQGLKAHGGQCH